jgi:phosphoenolpyruvate carboxykinase (ATP)
MISAALSGALDDVPYRRDPIFNVEVPTSCPEVPASVLDPRGTWPDPAAYDAQAKKLAGMFAENFESFAGSVADDVKQAGPRG